MNIIDKTLKTGGCTLVSSSLINAQQIIKQHWPDSVATAPQNSMRLLNMSLGPLINGIYIHEFERLLCNLANQYKGMRAVCLFEEIEQATPEFATEMIKTMSMVAKRYSNVCFILPCKNYSLMSALSTNLPSLNTYTSADMDITMCPRTTELFSALGLMASPAPKLLALPLLPGKLPQSVNVQTKAKTTRTTTRPVLSKATSAKEAKPAQEPQDLTPNEDSVTPKRTRSKKI